MTIRLRTVLLAMLVLAALAGTAAFLVLRLGLYDIAATRQHTAPVFKLLDYAMRRSVQARAGAGGPADLGEARRIVAGAVHYRAHCLQCHGAPGVAPHPLAFGLTPAPANLLAAGRTWTAPEIFWVVRHGIKMSGMPAWVYRLADEEIWDVVAFVQAMPRMTPAGYARLADTLPAAQGAGHASGHASGPAAATAGDPRAGRHAAARHLCATCHTIPGLVSASHQVGPPLGGMARRGFIGGVLPNTPDNMVRWLRDPQAVDPLSAMPALGLSEQDARDIAAFLATLDK